MLPLLRNAGTFFAVWLAGCTAAVIYLPLCTTAGGFVQLNFFHCTFLNKLFICITYLGDGLFVLLVALAFAAVRRFDMTAKIAAAFIAGGLLAQLLKALVQAPRPRLLLQSLNIPYQHFIDGITRTGHNSFPSGHTAAFFALATLLALHTRSRWLQLVYILTAFAVGYSRIYLGHHFLEDVLTGSVIGVCTAVVVHLYAARRFGSRLQSKNNAYALQ